MRTANFPRGLNWHIGALIALLWWHLLAMAEPSHAEGSSQQAPAPVTAEAQWNRYSVHAGRIEQTSAATRQIISLGQQAGNDSMVSRVRSAIPSLEQAGASLKFDGNYVLVSAHGMEVIALIRQVPTRKNKELNDVLIKLQSFSRQGVPEAQNFNGFVYEYGLFGAPRNLGLARWFYEGAAAKRYQPAIFNLANMAYFGRGQPSDPEQALALILEAMSIGSEASNRVCGLASFIEYRRGDRDAATKHARSCYSALANVPNAAYDDHMPLPHRIKLLRDSIATGAPDGYRLLEEITRKTGPDQAYLYCKYRLINQVRFDLARFDVRALAQACYDSSRPNGGTRNTNSTVTGIASFVVSETRALDRLRRADRFHQTWSVPYLPFAQSDVDLYATILKDVK